MSELKCPFCDGEVSIVVCDDEGNIHDDEEGYEENPWSGLGYKLYHDETQANGECPIAGFEGEGALGIWNYYSRKEAIEAWNRRMTDEIHG